MIEIKPCGSFLNIDENGYIIKQANKSLIQEEWQPIVGETVDFYKNNIKDLVSVYVRGSVAKGLAVKNISDLDSFFISDKPTEINEAAEDKFNHYIKNKYPYNFGVEIFGGTKEDVLKRRENGKPTMLHELIKTQSTCVFGEDQSNSLSPVKLQEMSGPLKSLTKTIQAAKEELVGNTDKDDIKDLCTWIMKKIVRSGFEMYQEKEQKWTRDLYLCYNVFKKYQPKNTELMKKILFLSLNPTDQPEIIINNLDLTIKNIKFEGA